MAKAKKSKKAKKTTAKKTKRPAAKRTKKSASSKKTTRSAKSRGGNPAFMRPLSVSATLAGVVGGTSLSRPEVTKRLWNYIKRNKLQDAQERRYINADDKLKAVFGGRNRVSMFEMTKLVSKHLS